jgi:hypothetical protein
MRRTLIALGVFAAVAGCATLDTSKLPKMGVDFAFGQKHKCQGGIARDSTQQRPVRGRDI